MTEQLWGHDAIRIEFPYAVAKILATPDHGDRPELIQELGEALLAMIRNASLLDPTPLVTILDGILTDGSDMSMGPCMYIRKVFMRDVVREFAELKEELGL